MTSNAWSGGYIALLPHAMDGKHPSSIMDFEEVLNEAAKMVESNGEGWKKRRGLGGGGGGESTSIDHYLLPYS